MTARSRKYCWGRGEEFTTKEAAKRMVKEKEYAMKDFWGEKYISSEIIEGSNYYQVALTHK